MFQILNLSLAELTQAAREKAPIVVNGENYYISNMVWASDNTTTKAKIIMTSATTPRKHLELDLSAKFSTGWEVR